MKLFYAAVVFILPAYSLAQNKTPIFVLPNDTASEENRLEHTQKKFKHATEILTDPSLGNINEENIPANIEPGSSPSLKNISDLANKISSAQVEHFGGEAGSLRVRLRGARAFEPTYYFNGLPLAGAGSSEQTVTLIPIAAISQLAIYPDNPPFWLNSMGISGDINVLTCQRDTCFRTDKNSEQNLFRFVTRTGSYHYWQNSISHALKSSHDFKTYSAIEYSSSKDDYPVFNNNNSILNSSAGQYQNLQNNDFKKASVYFGLNSHQSWVGKISNSTLYTDFDKGIPGAVGSSTNARLKKKLFLLTVSTEKLNSNNGILWNNQLGILLNKSEIENFTNGFSAQANNSLNTTLQLKSWLSIPTEFIYNEKSGITFEYLNFSQKTASSVPAVNNNSYDSSSKGQRHDFRLGVFESILIPVKDNYSLSLNANAWVSVAQAQTEISCNNLSMQSNCNSSFDKNEKNLYGYLLSFQHKYENIINYLRYSLSTRRPYLSELYGAPGGVLANTDLLEEKSKKIEFGLIFPYIELGYFYTFDNNLIFLHDIGQNSSQYQNIEDSYRNGFFLSSDYYIYEKWKLFLIYQYINSRMLRNDNEYVIPRSSTHSVNTGTSIENINLVNFDKSAVFFAAYFNLNWQSEFYLDYMNINKVQIPPIYNSGFSFLLSNNSKQKQISLALDIYNIANETYATVSNSTGFSQQMQTNGYIGYPPPGRRFYLTISGEI